jgi:hypothetical protein
MAKGNPGIKTIRSWDELLEWKPAFPAMMHKWLRRLTSLVIHTHPQDNDLVGRLIVNFINACLPDINDFMTLTHADSHHGALKILRSLYERTVTLKYIAANPSEAEKFMDFDAIDWDQVLVEIEKLTGFGLTEPSRTNLKKRTEKARQEFKQAPCPQCGMRKQTSWTKLTAKDMASRVDMGHMHLLTFVMPSKLIHPTAWGMREVNSLEPPLYNNLHSLHELIVQLVLIHRRHFEGGKLLTPMMYSVIEDFLSVWVIAQTSFGGLLREYKPGTFIAYYITDQGGQHRLL